MTLNGKGERDLHYIVVVYNIIFSFLLVLKKSCNCKRSFPQIPQMTPALLPLAIIIIMISLPLIAIVVYGVDKGTQNTLSELQQHNKPVGIIIMTKAVESKLRNSCEPSEWWDDDGCQSAFHRPLSLPPPSRLVEGLICCWKIGNYRHDGGTRKHPAQAVISCVLIVDQDQEQERRRPGKRERLTGRSWRLLFRLTSSLLIIINLMIRSKIRFRINWLLLKWRIGGSDKGERAFERTKRQLLLFSVLSVSRVMNKCMLTSLIVLLINLLIVK